MALTDNDDRDETRSFAEGSAAAIRVIRRALANLEGLGAHAHASQTLDVACAIDALKSEDFGQACLCAECSHAPRDEGDAGRARRPAISIADLSKRLAALVSVMSVMTHRAYLKV